MAEPVSEAQVAAALERAARHGHAMLEAREAELAQRRGAREPIDLFVLPHGIPEAVAAMPGWLEVGWILRHGEPEYWNVLVELGTGGVKVKHVRK